MAFIGPPLLELTYPLALEMVLHSAIVTDFTMERLPDSLSMSVTPFMQPNLSRKFASVLKEKQSHEWSAASEGKDRNSSLTGHTNEWHLSSDRRAFTGSSISECPNSVRVTFSRRSPQCRPLGLRNQVQSREKRAWNSSRRSHVRSCNSFENTESSGSNLE